MDVVARRSAVAKAQMFASADARASGQEFMRAMEDGDDETITVYALGTLASVLTREEGVRMDRASGSLSVAMEIIGSEDDMRERLLELWGPRVQASAEDARMTAAEAIEFRAHARANARWWAAKVWEMLREGA